MEELRGRHAARRSHRKVRTGCKTCKARKIKCDEARPECANCIRHGVTCDVLHSQQQQQELQHHHHRPVTREGRQDDGNISRSSSKHAFRRNNLTTNIRRPLPSSPSSPSSPGHGGHDGLNDTAALPSALPDLNMLDLELLHHWTTSTCETITDEPHLHSFWRHSLVAVGLKCDFIMRIMLALAALHLAHLSPDREPELVEKAVSHQNRASRSAIEAMAELDGDSEDGDLAHNLGCYANLNIIVLIANSRNAEDAVTTGSRPPSDAPDWIRFFSGVWHLGFLFRRGRNDPKRHPVWPLRRHAIYRRIARDRPVRHPHINRLRAYVAAAQGIEPDRRAIYDHAIAELHQSFGMFYESTYQDAGAAPATSPQDPESASVPGTAATSDDFPTPSFHPTSVLDSRLSPSDFPLPHPTTTTNAYSSSSHFSPSPTSLQSPILHPYNQDPDVIDLFIWLARVPGFFPLLCANPPAQETLAIFSYFCMLPKRLPQRWWLDGWADNLRTHTYEQLDAEHRAWVVEPTTLLGGSERSCT